MVDALLDQLHLTKVGAVCSLQPLLHHLDAYADQQKADARAGRDIEGESEPRAINLTVKSTDDEELEVGEIGKTLRAMQEEPWQRLEWVDQDVRLQCLCDSSVSSMLISQRTIELSPRTQAISC